MKKNKIILIVSKDTAFCRNLMKLISKPEWKLSCFEDYKLLTADFLAQVKPNLILFDFCPCKESQEIKQIINNEYLCQVPIIFLAEFSCAHHFLELKITDPFGFVLKPIRKRELELCIKMAFYRKEFEEKEFEDNSRKKAVLNSLSEGIAIFNPDHNLIFLSKSAGELFGVQPEQIHGLKLNEFLIVDGFSENDFLGSVIRNGSPVENEDSVFLLVKEKLLLNVSYRATPLYDVGHRCTGVILVFSDNSEMLQLRGKLQENKELLELALNEVEEGVLLSDFNGEIILLNRSAKTLLAPFIAVLKGHSISNLKIIASEFISGNGFPELNKMKNRVNQFEIITQLQDEFGNPVVLSFITRPVKGLHGESEGILIVFSNKSHRNYKNDESIKNEKMKSLGFLAGGIAHEFNNILTAAIARLTSLRLKSELGSPMTIPLAKTEQILMRGSKLTSQLIIFSDGGIPVKKMGSLKQHLKKVLDENLPDPAIKLNWECEPGDFQTEADFNLIEQLFTNLILNAKQSMNNRGILTVRISHEKLTIENRVPNLPDGLFYKIEFEDSGSGISDEVLPYIFDPFFSTKDQSGLGLSVAWAIVNRHNGALKVKTQKDKGSVFTVYLPVSVNQENVVHDVVPEKRIYRPHILILEDDEMLKEVFVTVFDQLNFEAELATTGEEALKLYKKCKSDFPFHAVILDLKIKGGKGGRETMGDLLAFDPDVKAIVSSGYSSDPVMANYRDYGFKDVVVKPYDFDEINQKLRKIIFEN